jgi:preprotein translocase subunit SecE
MATGDDNPERRDDDDLTQPRREAVPGQLDHASGEVDEFQAGLVSGADGEPSDVGDEELERQAGAAATPSRQAVPGAPTRRGAGRFFAFLGACWAELQRVQWPDRRQVGQGTAVVIGFVIVAGAFLGVADEVATRVVDIIL